MGLGGTAKLGMMARALGIYEEWAGRGAYAACPYRDEGGTTEDRAGAISYVPYYVKKFYALIYQIALKGLCSAKRRSHCPTTVHILFQKKIFVGDIPYDGSNACQPTRQRSTETYLLLLISDPSTMSLNHLNTCPLYKWALH